MAEPQQTLCTFCGVVDQVTVTADRKVKGTGSLGVCVKGAHYFQKHLGSHPTEVARFTSPLLRSLLPYLLAQAALLIAVLFMPELTHIGQSAAERSRKPPDITRQELEQRFEQMLPPMEPPPLDFEPGK